MPTLARVMSSPLLPVRRARLSFAVRGAWGRSWFYVYTTDMNGSMRILAQLVSFPSCSIHSASMNVVSRICQSRWYTSTGVVPVARWLLYYCTVDTHWWEILGSRLVVWLEAGGESHQLIMVASRIRLSFHSIKLAVHEFKRGQGDAYKNPSSLVCLGLVFIPVLPFSLLSVCMHYQMSDTRELCCWSHKRVQRYVRLSRIYQN